MRRCFLDRYLCRALLALFDQTTILLQPLAHSQLLLRLELTPQVLRFAQPLFKKRRSLFLEPYNFALYGRCLLAQTFILKALPLLGIQHSKKSYRRHG